MRERQRRASEGMLPPPSAPAFTQAGQRGRVSSLDCPARAARLLRGADRLAHPYEANRHLIARDMQRCQSAQVGQTHVRLRRQVRARYARRWASPPGTVLAESQAMPCTIFLKIIKYKNASHRPTMSSSRRRLEKCLKFGCVGHPRSQQQLQNRHMPEHCLRSAMRPNTSRCKESVH